MRFLSEKKLEKLLSEERKETFYKMRIIFAQIKFEASEILSEEKNLSKQSMLRLEHIIGLISQNI